MRDPWSTILDDLERRVVAAEAGDLTALEGWAPPAAQPAPMTVDEQLRATGVLARQRTLTSRLREDQKAVAASLRGLRRPRYKAATAPPVYVDRIG